MKLGTFGFGLDEDYIARAMLAFERGEAKRGARPKLPCDRPRVAEKPLSAVGVDVLRLMRSGPMTAREVADRLDLTIHQAANNIHRLSLCGRVRRLGSAAPNRNVIYEVIER